MPLLVVTACYTPFSDTDYYCCLFFVSLRFITATPVVDTYDADAALLRHISLTLLLIFFAIFFFFLSLLYCYAAAG